MGNKILEICVDDFLNDLQQLNIRRLWLAYSGGLDSHVLLHLFATHSICRQHYQVHAIHVNHGLHENAETWQRHCQQICEQLQIPFYSHKLDLNLKAGDSIEAVARDARYQALRGWIIFPDDCLLTAHHQSDQVETVLLQLFRGAGPKGLAAMAKIMLFAAGYLYRPLLSIPRQQLLEYAQQQQLQWIEDPSNQQKQYARNFLRHEVLPILKKRWPGVEGTIARAARHNAAAAKCLSDLGEMDVIKVCGRGNALSISALQRLDLSRRQNVIRVWLQLQQFPVPTEKKLRQIFQDVCQCREDANPCVAWQYGERRVEVRRYRNELHALTPFAQVIDLKAIDPIELAWDFQKLLKLPGDLGELYATPVTGLGIRQDCVSSLQVRLQRHPLHKGRSLKKYYQKWDVPPWLRGRIPLLYDDHRLVAITGYGIHSDYEAGDDEPGWEVCVDLD